MALLSYGKANASSADIIMLAPSNKLRDVCLQGVLCPEDAHMGVEAGADGVIVSNHGGRQLDYAPASLDALPGIAAAVGKRVPVLVDGGVRRGTDIIKVG